MTVRWEREWSEASGWSCSPRNSKPGLDNGMCEPYTSRENWRRILNIRWPEVISNEELWGRTNQSHIEESIKRRKWKWIGYTLRKPENNITRSALEWNPQVFRRRGRPRQSWRRSLLDELAKKNITWLEAKKTAKNRVRWRSMVDALCFTLGVKMA